MLGVKSVSIEGEGGELVVVTGEDVDSVKLTKLLRKKLRHATLMSVQDVTTSSDEAAANNEAYPISITNTPTPIYYTYHPYNYPHLLYDPYPHNNCSLM